MENIEGFFAINPNTPPATTNETTREERRENWHERIEKAKEQAKINPAPYSQVFSLVNDFFNAVKEKFDESEGRIKIELFPLDDNIQALILDNGIIIAQKSSWDAPKYDNKKRKYVSWDTKYDKIKEKFNLRYQSDIIWLKFTKKHHLGVVAKSFDINYRSDNTAGKLVNIIEEEWDDSFVFIFPLTQDILNKGYETGDIERAIGNYLISKGIPIIDFFSHNY